MRIRSKHARIGGLCRALAFAAVAMLAPLGPSRVAADESTAPADAPVDAERWWGAAGAILCGTEVRLIRVAPAIGMNPYVLAAGVGGCLLAVMDIISHD